MARKIHLGNDGVVSFNRMQPMNVSASNKRPAKRVSRIKELMDTGSPNICIVRGEGIGDVLMTLPTIDALRRTFNDKCRITYATNIHYMDGALSKVLSGNPSIDAIIDRSQCREEDYDLVVNLHCPAIALEQPQARPPNRIDIFAAHAGVKIDDPRPKFYLTEEEAIQGAAFFRGRQADQSKRLLVHVSATGSNRSLSNLKLKNILTRLYAEHGVMSFIITHDGDQDDIFWNEFSGIQVVKNKDIRELAAIMVHCDMVLCPDSSIMHLAGSLSIPTVAVFGPTDPAARVNHYPNTVALWGGDGLLPCPCWTNQCPIRFACWTNITEDMVIKSCMDHLAKTSRVPVEKVLNGGTIFKQIDSEMI